MSGRRGTLDRHVPVRRLQGDGASTPEDSGEVLEPGNKDMKGPFSVQLEVDVMQWMLFVVALATRMWKLEYPRSAVFDELHFGRSAAMYLRNTFHFDVHPPLGTMMMALAGYYAGYSGDFKFDKIGAEYPLDLPVWHLRFFPACLGSLVAPLMYQIMVEMKATRWTASLAACLFIFDNAMLVQSRFMLLEGILLSFIVLTLLACLKFRKINTRNPFSAQWWMWLLTMGVSGTLALSVRYIGGATLILILGVTLRDLWRALPVPSMTDLQLTKHIMSRLVALVAVPVAVYLSIFYVHLGVLTKAGPHDDILTSAFQASLDGGLAAITRGQPLEVVYGSQVTLRHTYGTPCWLHSHNAVYPVRYEDSRGSSHQQQVTCYQFKDVNNWWIVKHPNSQSLVVDEPKRPVRNGDIIQLIHGMSSRALNSHDVAAPMSPQHQEVTGYIDYNVSHAPQNLWRLEIVNGKDSTETWKTIQSHIRLVHVNTSQAVKISGKQLPDWGFYQLEVVADRIIQQDATVWNVEEHRYSKSPDSDQSKKDLAQAEMIPLKPTHLNFFTKFWELQVKMLTSPLDVQLEHQYSSGPLEWPLLETNIAYWLRPQDFAQIHLVGNPVIWYSGTLAVVIYLCLLVVYLVRRRRACYDIPQELFEEFVWSGEVFLTGYLLHYIPYLLLDRTLFLYFYLPALLYQMLLLTTLIQHIYALIWSAIMRRMFLMLVVVWVTAVGNTFLIFSQISYGFTAVTEDDLSRLTWKHSWNFLRKVKL